MSAALPPGQPANAPTDSQHPIKARLLARARLAKGEGTDEDRRLLGDSPAQGVPSMSGELPPEAADGEPPGSREQAPHFIPTQALAQPSDDLADEVTEPETKVLVPGSDEQARAAGEEPKGRDPSLTPPPGAVASELERIAGRGGSPPPQRPGLSPNMTALVSALVGLSLVGTLGIFLKPFDFDSKHPGKEQPEEAPAKAVEEPPEAARPERKVQKGPWRVEDDRHKPGHRVLSGVIGKDAFLRAIQDAGLPKSGAYVAYGALKGQLDLDHCGRSDIFRALVQGPNKQLVAFEYEKSREEVYQVKADDNGAMTAQRLDLKVERNQIRRAFVFDGKSFDDSARAGGFDPGLLKVTQEALRGHLRVDELNRGDRLRIIAQELTVLGDFARYTGIEALEINRPGKAPQRIYYYSHPSEGGYFDEDGKAPYEGGWRKPITDAPVTSHFNMKRRHPVLDRVMPHTGTDFGAPMGTPIGATSPGTVSFIGNAGPSGNLVKVDHGGGYESGYAHLSRFEKGLKVGDKVGRMQVVGYCGSTGRSTGPHLHFTMKKDGQFINPLSLHLDGLRVLPPSHRPLFDEVRAKYDPLLEAIELPAPLETAQVSPAESSLAEASAADSNEDSSADEGNPMMQDEPSAPTESQAVPTATREDSAAAPPPSAAAPAHAVKPSAIFLSDQELLRLQSATDDGEVAN